jgi:hypothetical protein
MMPFDKLEKVDELESGENGPVFFHYMKHPQFVKKYGKRSLSKNSRFPNVTHKI